MELERVVAGVRRQVPVRRLERPAVRHVDNGEPSCHFLLVGRKDDGEFESEERADDDYDADANYEICVSEFPPSAASAQPLRTTATVSSERSMVSLGVSNQVI